jgi:CcmD family protein
MSVALEAGVAIYVAMAVALAVWIGIWFYLWRIDASAQRMRRELERLGRETTAAPAAPQSRVTRVSEQAEEEVTG